MNNLSAWRHDDEWSHIIEDYENGEFEMITEHTEEILALLEYAGLPSESWVYGSYGRALHGSWFRVEGATIIHTTGNSPYSYAVVPARMDRADVDGNELDLVSRPARGYMPKIEIRGYFQITIYPDHEIWQLKYSDGTLGEAHQIDNDDTTLEVCSVCNRRWSPQDRNLAYDHDGKMTCPDCQNK